MQGLLEGKRLLITGGTGSLGKTLVRRALAGDLGTPAKIIVFSRDEAKQHQMRMDYLNRPAATDEVIYRNFQRSLEFRIGDVRDYHSVATVLQSVDIVINAAALKQVPTCEYFPFEAVRTNVQGAENIVRAIHELRIPVETVVGVSTDKACKPVNVMGMTKALQERIFIQGNLRCPGTRFICVRYGNVLASRGSVIPLFHDQIRNGGPVTVTSSEMTRFLLSLDDAVDTIFAALAGAHPGETYVPRAPSARIIDVARLLIGKRDIEVRLIGIRPGEKVHETLISDEEAHRAVERDRWYAILPMLPELSPTQGDQATISGEFSSGTTVLSCEETAVLLRQHRLMPEDVTETGEETLR